MKNILVSIDFSETTDHVISYATNLCVELKAELTLFHAYQVPIAYSDMPVVTLSLEEVKNNAEIKLKTIKEKIEDLTGNKIKIEIHLKLGEPALELEQLNKELNPFLILMGTGNSTALERTFVGSTVLHAINHLHKPILIIPKEAKYRHIQKIGLACDFLKVEKTTPTDMIQTLSKSFNANVHIIHVEVPNESLNIELTQQKNLLQEILSEVNPIFHSIKDPNIEHGINQFATESEIDLLIMIPKKHQLIERIFQKSHTKTLVFHSHIPVLSIHE